MVLKYTRKDLCILAEPIMILWDTEIVRLEGEGFNGIVRIGNFCWDIDCTPCKVKAVRVREKQISKCGQQSEDEKVIFLSI